MDSFLRDWLAWPAVEHFFTGHVWAWPLCETFHFFGVCLLIGGVGMFDLRVLGFAKALPLAVMRRLLSWAVFGFTLTVVTGVLFVLGFRADLPIDSYDVLKADAWLQLKLLSMFLAGINLSAFYLSGTSRVVDGLGAGDDAPPAAKAMAGASLLLWLGVIYFGRLIPEGLPTIFY